MSSGRSPAHHLGAASLAGLFVLTTSLAHAQAVPVAASGPRQDTSVSQGAAQSAADKSPDDWRFAATLYGWAINLNGSASVRGNNAAINASVIDLIQKSSSLAAVMGNFEANKGRFGFFADLVWAQLGIPASVTANRNPLPGVSLTAQANAFDTVTLTIFEAAGVYEVGKWTGEAQSFTALDFYAGGRFWNLSNELNVDLTATATGGGASVSRSVSLSGSPSVYWADPMIGLRLRHQFTPSQSAFVMGDVGGFGLTGSSLFSWHLAAVYSYTWQMSGYALAANIGYRALSTNVNFTNGSPGTDNLNLVIHGPLIGLTVKF
jgi:hypothetical protein